MKILDLLSSHNVSVEIFGAFIAALIIVIRKYLTSFFYHCYLKTKKLINKMKIFSIHESLNSIKTELHHIKSELRPNGGGSLRDAINRIDEKIDDISSKVVKINIESEITSDIFNICRWVADENGLFNFVNKSLKQLVGVYEDSVCLQDSWISNLVFVDDRNKTKEEWARSVNSKSEFHHTFRVKNLSDGNVFFVTSHGKPVFDENNNLIGWIGVFIPSSENLKQ